LDNALNTRLDDLGHDRMAQPVVLLGASNLIRAFPLVVRGLQAGLPGRLHILAAGGHGRSYGQATSILGRVLPGIIQCELWAALERIPTENPRTMAAIVDLGNDIAYGVSVSKVLEWLQDCLERLSGRNSEVVLMSLPIESLERLPRWRFELLRRVYFPAHPVAWPVLIEQLRRLQDEVCRLAPRYGVHLVKPSAVWYGFDPIHVLRRCEPRVWQELFSRWSTWNRSAALMRPSWDESIRVRLLRPADYSYLGHRQIVAQPVFAAHRVSVSLY